MACVLLSKGADVNAITEDDYTKTALQASIMAGNLNMIDFLLANGARINVPIVLRGCSELAYAADTGDIRLVRELLDRGAEINSASPDSGRTALQAAATLQPANMAMVQLLLERGAGVNAPGQITVLQAATAYGHFQLALLFLEAGADINAQSREQPWSSDFRTALETAAGYGRLDILYLLLKAGADMHLPIEERYLGAAERAGRRGHFVIAEILEEWNKNGGAQDDRESWIQDSRGKRRVVDID